MTNLKVSEYIQLIRAGYTAEQIEAEYGAQSPEQPEMPQEQSNIQPEEEFKPEEKPAEAPKAEPVQSSNPSLDALLAEIKLLRGDIQKSNILTSSADIQTAPTAEQILATLIAPPGKEKGK